MRSDIIGKIKRIFFRLAIVVIFIAANIFVYQLLYKLGEKEFLYLEFIVLISFIILAILGLLFIFIKSKNRLFLLSFFLINLVNALTQFYVVRINRSETPLERGLIHIMLFVVLLMGLILLITSLWSFFTRNKIGAIVGFFLGGYYGIPLLFTGMPILVLMYLSPIFFLLKTLLPNMSESGSLITLSAFYALFGMIIGAFIQGSENAK